MIIQEQMKCGTRDFIHTYSDKYVFIERDGRKYCSAMDLAENGFEYTETGEKIYHEEEFEYMPIELRFKVQNAYAELDSKAH